MKQIFFKGMLCAAAAAALGACTDGIGLGFDSTDAQGKIALNASVDCSLANSRSRAEYNEVGLADLSLRLTSADGSYTHTWESVGEFDTNQLFPVGTYTLEAFYGDESAEGYESPYFYGTTTFKVEENETTPVGLEASLANALLDISFTENFTSYMAEYSAEVHSAGGSYFSYDTDLAKPIYTRAGKVEVSVEFTKPNGQQAKLVASEFDAEPRHFYHVTVDVTNDGNGVVNQLVVTFDDGLADESRDIDISDEVMNAPAPVVTPLGFDPSEPLELVAGVAPDYNVGFDVIAYGGLKALTLTTRSASLAGQGWPPEINLIGTDISALTALGFEAKGVGKPDKMAVLTLSDVLHHITYVEGADNTTEFTLVARDSYGKVSESVSLTILTDPLSLTLDSGEYGLGENVISFAMTYNGNSPEDVTVQYHNTRGTWTTLKPEFTEGDAKGVYNATAPIAPTYTDVQLRASAPGTATVELTVKPKPRTVVDTKASINAFATFAYIPVTTGTDNSDFAELTQGVKAYVSADGDTYSEATIAEVLLDSKYIKVEGLKANASNYVKIVNAGQAIEVVGATSIDTEQPSTLTNGELDEWNVITNTERGSGLAALLSASCDVYSTEGWATFNDLTTSKLVYNTKYSALSSTLSNNNGHNDKCALIRSVGFGCTGATGNNSNPTEFSQGELFLGTYSMTTGPSYGIAFDSRPVSMSFWYKYTPATNSADCGYAEITLLDATGGEIASKAVALEAADNFTEQVVALDYNFSSAKAASIKVIFRSTNAGTEYLNSTYMPKKTTLGSLSDYYVGSQLFVDDIVLNY